MAEYIASPLELEDPSDIEDAVYEHIQTYFPEWEPREGHLVVILTEAYAQEIADTRYKARSTPPDIFAYLGGLVGITREVADTSTALSTWTMIDSAGHTIPAGTVVRLLISGDEYAAFEVVEEVTVPPGSSATASGEVVLQSVVEGADSNNLGGTAELVDVLDFVNAVNIVGTTSGGSDDENIDDYLDRLTTRLRLMADRPITPQDFENLALTMDGVSRALALDTYNPSNDTFNNEKYVTVVMVDDAGAAVSAGLKTEFETLAESLREVNFVVRTADPSFTAVTISATVVALPGYDPATLETEIETAITEFLNPATWGLDPNADTTWLKPGYDKVRYHEIGAVINSVNGVNYIDGAVTINGNANTDLTLTGRAPLPAANPTVTITVNAA